MQPLNQTIVVNVGAHYIETYLRRKNYIRTNEEKGLDIEYWVGKLFEEKKIDTESFEDFLFDELFWGKRKSIRIYKINNINKIKAPMDWMEPLLKEYQIDNLNFKNILKTIPTASDQRKIAAITSETNYKGNLTKLRILFVCFAEFHNVDTIEQTSSYYPVEIDFTNKTMILKAWDRHGLTESYKTEQMMDKIKYLMTSSFKVSFISFTTRHKRVLYNMSQGLIMNIYKKIPAFNQIEELYGLLQNFQQDILQQLSLNNTQEHNGIYSISKGVFDFEDEIHKLIEKLCVSDFFYDIPYENIWKMDGIDTIISKIRFNDIEHVLASLNGEDSEVPIFCTKTFMALKKSMEDAETVERLWIVKDRNRGKLSLSYDATKEEFLGIRILSNIRFKQEDLTTAEEIYNRYESEITTQITTKNQRFVV